MEEEACHRAKAPGSRPVFTPALRVCNVGPTAGVWFFHSLRGQGTKN